MKLFSFLVASSPLRSFSALADVADAATKTEHRKGKKVAQSHYDPYNLNVPVVIVTSEVAPYSKKLARSCLWSQQGEPENKTFVRQLVNEKKNQNARNAL